MSCSFCNDQAAQKIRCIMCQPSEGAVPIEEWQEKTVTLVCDVYRHEKIIPESEYSPDRFPACPRCSYPMSIKLEEDRQ